MTPGDNSTTIVSANIDNNTIIVDSATKKLKTHYNFTKPLTYDIATGKVTLSIDDVTLKVVNNKLTGNYTGKGGINVVNGVISAIVDNDTMKINGGG